MRLRTAATLAAALSVLGLAPAAASATPQPVLGTTTPAVGDCHALSAKEVSKPTDPDAPVDCSTAHTSMTIKVVEVTSPDWSDMASVWRQADRPCHHALSDELGSTKKAQLSAYTLAWFIPTKAQRDAGAAWVRCDATLLGGRGSLLALPSGSDITLGSLPLSDKFARCRMGKPASYAIVSCSKRHVFHATKAFKHAGTTYPGLKRIVKWTVDRCRASLGRSFGYYAAPTRANWRSGLRYSVCYKSTRS